MEKRNHDFKTINGQVARLVRRDNPKAGEDPWAIERYLRNAERPLHATHCNPTSHVRPQEFEIR